MADDRMDSSPYAQLQDLLLESEDITAFLGDFTKLMAEKLAAGGEEVWCAVTLLRERRSATVASSSDRAEALDEIQYHVGDGPCLTAAREHRVVYVPDMRRETRWPDYTEVAARNGILSALGVPFELGGEAAAGLDIYSDQPDKYDDTSIEAVRQEVLLASKGLRLAVRLARQADATADMEAAMQSRTSIDLAVGIIMGQNNCSQDAAFEILKSASSGRNIKLRDLAASIVASVGGGPAKTHFNR